MPQPAPGRWEWFYSGWLTRGVTFPAWDECDLSPDLSPPWFLIGKEAYYGGQGTLWGHTWYADDSRTSGGSEEWAAQPVDGEACAASLRGRRARTFRAEVFAACDRRFGEIYLTSSDLPVRLGPWGSAGTVLAAEFLRAGSFLWYPARLVPGNDALWEERDASLQTVFDMTNIGGMEAQTIAERGAKAAATMGVMWWLKLMLAGGETAAELLDEATPDVSSEVAEPGSDLGAMAPREQADAARLQAICARSKQDACGECDAHGVSRRTVARFIPEG